MRKPFNKHGPSRVDGGEGISTFKRTNFVKKVCPHIGYSPSGGGVFNSACKGTQIFVARCHTYVLALA